MHLTLIDAEKDFLGYIWGQILWVVNGSVKILGKCAEVQGLHITLYSPCQAPCWAVCESGAIFLGWHQNVGQFLSHTMAGQGIGGWYEDNDLYEDEKAPQIGWKGSWNRQIGVSPLKQLLLWVLLHFVVLTLTQTSSWKVLGNLTTWLLFFFVTYILSAWQSFSFPPGIICVIGQVGARVVFSRPGTTEALQGLISFPHISNLLQVNYPTHYHPILTHILIAFHTIFVHILHNQVRGGDLLLS